MTYPALAALQQLLQLEHITQTIIKGDVFAASCGLNGKLHVPQMVFAAVGGLRCWAAVFQRDHFRIRAILLAHTLVLTED